MLREVRRELPGEDLRYVADSACAPWGDRSEDFVTARALQIAEALVDAGAKALVVACNTATGVAVKALRARFSLPIVGIEPAVKPAALGTRSGVVGVLATRRTVEADNFTRLRDAHGRDVRILAQACPGLVECVESGALDTPRTRALLTTYVAPLLAEGADTLVLACTHFPWLAGPIRSIAGPGVDIIDPAPAVARELRRRLALENLLAAPERRGRTTAFTTGEPARFRQLLAVLGESATEVERLDLPTCAPSVAATP